MNREKVSRSPQKRDGEFYCKILDRDFNKIFEGSVGLNDKKGLRRLAFELKHKGVDLVFREGEVDDGWW